MTDRSLPKFLITIPTFPTKYSKGQSSIIITRSPGLYNPLVLRVVLFFHINAEHCFNGYGG